MNAAGSGGVLGARRQQRQAQRRRQFQVTLSAEERELLAGYADEQGVSLARLLVQSAVDHAQRGELGPSEQRRQVLVEQNETRHQLAVAALELSELRRLLATVANNVNQLAKMANVGGDTAGMRELSGTLVEVEELLRALRGWSASEELSELPALLDRLRVASGPRR